MLRALSLGLCIGVVAAVLPRAEAEEHVATEVTNLLPAGQEMKSVKVAFPEGFVVSPIARATISRSEPSPISSPTGGATTVSFTASPKGRSTAVGGVRFGYWFIGTASMVPNTPCWSRATSAARLRCSCACIGSMR